MPHLLVIDVTLGAVAIVVATWIVLRSGRSAGPSKRHAEVAELTSEGSALGETGEGSDLGETVVPGFSEGEDALDPDARGPYPGGREPDPRVHKPDPDTDATDPDIFAPDPGVREPGGQEEAPPQVSVVADADPGADDGEPVAHDPEPGVREPARPEQAPSLGNGVAGTGPGAHAPAAEPDGQPGADGTVTSSGRVYSYYDGADQPMADYLAELGWSEESGARDPW